MVQQCERGASPAIDVAEAIFTRQFAHMERLSAQGKGIDPCSTAYVENYCRSGRKGPAEYRLRPKPFELSTVGR